MPAEKKDLNRKKKKARKKTSVLGVILLTLDAGAAAENMALMASELGYASCFVGAFDEEACRAFVRAGEGEKPVVLLPVGVPAQEIPLRDRKPFEESVTFIGNCQG